MMTYLLAGGLAIALVGLPYSIFIAVRPGTPSGARVTAVLVSLSMAFLIISLGINLFVLR